MFAFNIKKLTKTMEKIFAFYSNPFSWRIERDEIKDIFKKNLILYVVVAVISSFVFSYFGVNLGENGRNNANESLFLLKSTAFILRAPFQVLIYSIFIFLVFRTFRIYEFKFIELYQVLFLSFSMMIFSFILEAGIIFVQSIFHYDLFNILKYSLADLLLRNRDCSNIVEFFYSKISVIFLIIVVYAYFSLKNIFKIRTQKYCAFFILAFLLSTFFLSSIPAFFYFLFGL